FEPVSKGGTAKGEEVATTLESLFGALSGSSGSAYQGILTQYFDPVSRVSHEMVFTPWIDQSVAAPASVGGTAVHEEIERALEANNTWTVEPNAQFVVATAPGTTYESGFAAGVCAYHGIADLKGAKEGAVMAFDPYQGDQPFGNSACLRQDEEGNPVHMTS